MAKILRKLRSSNFQNFQKSILNYYIQTIKDGIHIRVYKINNESVVHFCQLISLKR